MPRAGVALFLLGIALTGCEAVLGVEDVVLDGSGGAGGSGSGATSLGAGAGFAVAGTTVSGSSGTDASASSGSGPGCQPELPACAGARPSAFEEEEDFDEEWIIDQRKAEVHGEKLELDPDEDVAAIRAPNTIEVGTACAVWITHLSAEDDESSVGIAVGNGAPGGERIALFRTGDAVVASSQGQAIGTLALPDTGAPHVLRLRFDGAGSAAADVKGVDGCYQQVASSANATGGPPSVTIFQVGREGKSELDDFCL